MANGLKLLIDTNVLIGLEDWKEIPASFAKLQNLCSKYSYRLYVHEAALADIARDLDAARRRVTLSKVEKFERLAGIKTPGPDALSERFGRISKPNDLVDATLLYALELGAVDFLITEDQGLHTRARRTSTDLADRVLTVAETVEWLVGEHEPRTVHLPLVEDQPAHAIDPKDAIFDSLRDGYPEFDRWWKEKCIGEHRPCWVVTIGGTLAGIIVRKDEYESGVGGTTIKTLKLCTFKVKPEFRGEKLGELLLKQALWFAQINSYDRVYLTTFPEQSVLIGVLEYYGFVQTTKSGNGELRLEKQLSRSKLVAPPGANLYEIARLNYPRFVAPPTAPLFYVPIKGKYHDVLFPELRDQRQQDLFEGSGSEGSGPRTPGNTIRKVYLCKSNSNQLTPGAVLLFYRSSSEPSELSQSVTTLGIVERVTVPSDLDGLVRLTAKRSVYSAGQMAEMITPNGRAVKAIDFLLVGHLAQPIALRDLVESGIFARTPPQSIAQLSAVDFVAVRSRLQFGFET